MQTARRQEARVEVTLVWRDGTKCQATVPYPLQPYVECGKAKFKLRPPKKHYTPATYREIA